MFEIEPGRAPIFTAAGPLLKHREQILSVASNDSLGAVTLGPYSKEAGIGADEGGTRKVLYWDEEHEAMYNYVQLKNPGKKEASTYLPYCVRLLQRQGLIVIIQITALPDEDPEEVLPEMADWASGMRADGIEIDGSCHAHSKIMCNDIEQTGSVITKIRDRVGQEPKVGLKVGPMALSIIRTYGELDIPFDFYTTMNSIPNQPVSLCR